MSDEYCVMCGTKLIGGYCPDCSTTMDDDKKEEKETEEEYE